jgi:hypothetical protein
LFVLVSRVEPVIDQTILLATSVYPLHQLLHILMEFEMLLLTFTSVVDAGTKGIPAE